jgi:hypothetical protein
MIQAWLMSTDDAILRRFSSAAPALRPDAVVVDWERSGKVDRQTAALGLIGVDTTIQPDDDHAVGRVRTLGFERVVCRIDAVGSHTVEQLAAVRQQGGTDVLIPMWREPREVEYVLTHSGGLRVGVMVETTESVRNCAVLRELDVSFAFVGLMDLALQRRTTSIFAPLVDGTLDIIAERLGELPFGFGGLTLPGAGRPIPDRLIVANMVRLGASFSFLRRSFLDNVQGADVVSALQTIRASLGKTAQRSPVDLDADYHELRVLLSEAHRDD